MSSTVSISSSSAGESKDRAPLPEAFCLREVRLEAGFTEARLDHISGRQIERVRPSIAGRHDDDIRRRAGVDDVLEVALPRQRNVRRDDGDRLRSGLHRRRDRRFERVVQALPGIHDGGEPPVLGLGQHVGIVADDPPRVVVGRGAQLECIVAEGHGSLRVADHPRGRRRAAV